MSFGARLFGCGKVALGFVVGAVFLGQCRLVSQAVGAVLGLRFVVQRIQIARFALEFLIGQFCVDAAQGDLFAVVVDVDGFAVGIGQGGVEPHKDLPGFDVLAFADQNLADKALLKGLDDLEVGLGDEFAFGGGNDVKFAERGPEDEQEQQNQQQVQHGASKRCGRLRLDA